jgi:DNA-binding ferritin-like protein
VSNFNHSEIVSGVRILRNENKANGDLVIEKVESLHENITGRTVEMKDKMDMNKEEIKDNFNVVISKLNKNISESTDRIEKLIKVASEQNDSTQTEMMIEEVKGIMTKLQVAVYIMNGKIGLRENLIIGQTDACKDNTEKL